MPWHYAESGKQIGPVEDGPFEGLVSAGVIRDDTLVWRPGMANWQPYAAVRPQAAATVPGAAGAPETRFCSECGKGFPPGELVAFGNSLVCAACKPVFTQKLMEGAQLPGAVRYGGFWIRVGATVIDGMLLYMVGLLVFGIAMLFIRVDWMNLGRTQADILQLLALEGILIGANVIFSALFETWFVGRFGATPGKMACGLKIVVSGGEQVSYLRALARHFAKYLNSLTLGLLYIMVGLDEEKRGLHDRICETRVIKK